MASRPDGEGDSRAPTDRHDGADASDVVVGPVGDAALRDPAVNPDMGADLGALPDLDDVEPTDG